jgi:signal transduction histidine kinase
MDQHRPPLLRRVRLRLRPAHWIVVDCVAAVLMAPSNKVGSLRCPLWVGLILLAMAVFPAALRRLWPRAALAVVVLGAAVATALDTRGYVPLAVGYAIYLIPLRVPRREALVLLLAALAVLAAGLGVYAANPAVLGDFGDTARLAAQDGLYVLVAWLAGFTVHQQRSYTAATRERAEREVREQLAQARRISSEQRLQIARELHDVLAHTVSLIAVQAGVANYVAETYPKEAARALASIEATSRGALREMRALLAMLRADGTDDTSVRLDAGLLPAPGLADLDGLVARTAEAGLLVELEVSGERPVLSAGIDLAAYRVIQEAVTNVLKHAGTDGCQVRVDYRQDGFCVQVTDGGAGGARAGAGLGHGLVGMRERVGMYGGRFHAGPLPGRGFQVTASFPLTGSES